MNIENLHLQKLFERTELCFEQVIKAKDRWLERCFDRLTPSESRKDFFLNLLVEGAVWSFNTFANQRAELKATLANLGNLLVEQVPNLFSLSRACLGPLLISFWQQQAPWSSYLALFSWALLSDYLDGALARRLKAISNLGKALDPLADKILAGCAAYIFWQSIWYWNLVLFLSSEIILITITIIGWLAHKFGWYKGSLVLGSNRFGQIKYNVQAVALVCLLLSFDYTANILLALANLLALGSIYRHLIPKKTSTTG
jgi:phosphatidylglycerophosphate synthase